MLELGDSKQQYGCSSPEPQQKHDRSKVFFISCLTIFRFNVTKSIGNFAVNLVKIITLRKKNVFDLEH
jgi:hypothetical protein